MQHLKGAAKGAQWDSDISSDSVDILDRSRKRRPVRRLLEKMGGLPEQEDFCSYALVGTKRPRRSKQNTMLSIQELTGKHFPYPCFLLLGTT